MCVPPRTYSLTFEHRDGYGLEGYLGGLQQDVERPAGLIEEIEVELKWLRHLGLR